MHLYQDIWLTGRSRLSKPSGMRWASAPADVARSTRCSSAVVRRLSDSSSLSKRIAVMLSRIFSASLPTHRRSWGVIRKLVAGTATRVGRRLRVGRLEQAPLGRYGIFLR